MQVSAQVPISAKAVYRNGARSARWAVGSLWASLVLGWVLLTAHAAHALLLWRDSIGVAVSERLFVAYDWTAYVLGEIMGVAFLCTIVFFIVWLTRACQNLRALNAAGLEFSVGWAVGAFFIPLLNLVAPYYVAQELWKASDPECLDPLDWKRTRASRRIGLWWNAYVLMGVAFYLISKYPPAQDASYTTWFSYTGVNALACVLTVVAAALAISFIRRVNQRQEEKHVRISSNSA